MAVRVRALARADEGDLRPVRRPGGRRIFELARGDLFELLRGDVEHVDVGVEALQIAFAVLLEVIAVEHDGRRGLPLPALHLLGLVGRILVALREDEFLAVRRPRVVAHAAVDLGQLLRLAAQAIQEPDLRALLLLVLGAPAGEEREVAAVRAPAGRTLALGPRRQAHRLRAVPAHHPQIAVALVLLDVDRRRRRRPPTCRRASAAGRRPT